MAILAGTTLVWPGTALDRLWAMNRSAYMRLAPIGRTVGPLFFLLSATLMAAARGWFKRRLWGWRLTAGIIGVQVAGDLVNFLRGDFLRGATGLVIASTFWFYLFRSKVRATFY